MLLECNGPQLVILDIDQLKGWPASELSNFKRRYPVTVLLSSRGTGRPGPIHVRPIGQPTDLAVKDVIKAQNVGPCDTLFITGEPREAARVGSMGVSTIIWGEEPPTRHNQLPDFLAGSYGDLMRFLSGGIFGYFGEMLAHGQGGTGLFHLYDLEHLLDPTITARVIVSGRYFPTEDRRHAVHPLSRRILDFKHGKHKNMLANIINNSLNVLNRSEQWDFITSVPGHDSSNRVGELLPIAAALKADLYSGVSIESDLLTVSRRYGSQKRSGNWSNRAINVDGAFRARRKVSGTGVLVDDVVTSGVTAMECVKVLQAAGAERVLVVAFGASQDTHRPVSGQPTVCPECGQAMQLRFNHRDETPLFGCRGYPKCHAILKYDDVRRQLNRDNVL